MAYFKMLFIIIIIIIIKGYNWSSILASEPTTQLRVQINIFYIKFILKTEILWQKTTKCVYFHQMP